MYVFIDIFVFAAGQKEKEMERIKEIPCQKRKR